MDIDELIKMFTKAQPKVSEELLNAYYGTDEEAEFSDWASGNFDDDVELGARLGRYEAYEEVINQLIELKGETK